MEEKLREKARKCEKMKVEAEPFCLVLLDLAIVGAPPRHNLKAQICFVARDCVDVKCVRAQIRLI